MDLKFASVAIANEAISSFKKPQKCANRRRIYRFGIGRDKFHSGNFPDDSFKYSALTISGF